MRGAVLLAQAVLLFAIVAAASFWLTKAAFGHGWYDPACCSDKDCARYLAKVAETPKAYVLEDGRFVDMGDPRIRRSADENFHVCERADHSIICLYVPDRGA